MTLRHAFLLQCRLQCSRQVTPRFISKGNVNRDFEQNHLFRLLENVRCFHSSRSLREQHDPSLFEPGKTYYDILGLSQTANIADIKRKFYELSKTHHPDRNPNDPTASDRFVKISQAYHVLANESSRSSYDRSLQQAQGSRWPSYTGGTGPAGGRAASGLSRRRTTQQGPPPSYYRNQTFTRRRTDGGGGGNSPYNYMFRDDGGFGIGGQTSSRTDDVPHFNWDEKYRQHHDYQQRQRRYAWNEAAADAARRAESVSTADFWFQAAAIGACVLLVGALGGWVASFRDKSSQTKPTGKT